MSTPGKKEEKEDMPPLMVGNKIKKYKKQPGSVKNWYHFKNKVGSTPLMNQVGSTPLMTQYLQLPNRVLKKDWETRIPQPKKNPNPDVLRAPYQPNKEQRKKLELLKKDMETRILQTNNTLLPNKEQRRDLITNTKRILENKQNPNPNHPLFDKGGRVTSYGMDVKKELLKMEILQTKNPTKKLQLKKELVRQIMAKQKKNKQEQWNEWKIGVERRRMERMATFDNNKYDSDGDENVDGGYKRRKTKRKTRKRKTKGRKRKRKSRKKRKTRRRKRRT